MLAAGGSAGALCAAPTADFLGRKWSVFLWGVVFVVGAIMQMIASYDVLLAGRFIGGMGVGASSMLTPQFLAENSPKSIRGSMTASYNLMILFSLMLAFFVNYGVSLWKFNGVEHDDTQWRVAMGIQLIPGVLMCLMIPFVPETPRYLINQGKSQQVRPFRDRLIFVLRLCFEKACINGNQTIPCKAFLQHHPVIFSLIPSSNRASPTWSSSASSRPSTHTSKSSTKRSRRRCDSSKRRTKATATG